MEVKLHHQIEVFMPEYLKAISELHEASLTPQLTVFTISKVKQISKKSFIVCLLHFQVA